MGLSRLTLRCSGLKNYRLNPKLRSMNSGLGAAKANPPPTGNNALEPSAQEVKGFYEP